ncbi:MAG: type I-E CRISPR-associated protein Cse1/CasA [Thermoplasmata archaeon]|jgi:CRISPR system Cascade subunit CasA|nr:type I-E CRISPR-associated protein Cse1/CasA [Thermoplasmata archaeon]
MFNLIDEKWIPVICKSGTIRKIAPWEITDNRDPPIKVCFSRPDFNSAVTQFLIGLVQTSSTPKDVDEWLDMLENPPSCEALKEKMSFFKDAFELIGGNHPFMQEPGVENRKSIDRILITSPGDNTVKLNKDFFIKRNDGRNCLCMSCAAASVYTLQALAPVGGSGIRCSMRGSSPLTTMVEGINLATTIFLNILIKDNLGSGTDGHIFPWMSDEKCEVFSSVDNDPRMVYWTVVRRIALGSLKEGTCMLCGSTGPSIVDYDEVSKGSSYSGWEHPLCPYSKDKTDTKPVKVSEGIGHLNEWTYMMYTGLSEVCPSKAVRQVQMNRLDIKEICFGQEIRLWINGYVNDKASVKAWKEIHQPMLMDYDERAKSAMTLAIADMIRLAEYGCDQLKKALKILYGPRDRSNIGRPVSIPSDLIESYWNGCDSIFEKFVSRIGPEDNDKLLLQWGSELHSVASSALDGAADSVPLEYYSNVALSRKNLSMHMSEKSISKELNK